jgi:hypothetical protein
MLVKAFAVVVVVCAGFGHSASAHGIAGNRYFPGTLTFDDPAVADESPTEISSFKHPAGDGTNVIDTAIESSCPGS